MPIVTRLITITLTCLVANSLAAKADALTFTYGGRETKLISNDNSTTIQTWSATNSYSAHMSDSGTVWYTTSSTTGGWGGMGGGSSCNQGAAWGNIVEVDWNGNTIRTITTDQLGGGTPHHAITLTDKGTVLAIVAETYNGTCGERLVEFDPQQNKVIWVWHTNDHEGSNSATKLKRGSSSNDPYHVNNVDLDTSSDQIVFSSHNVYELFVINHAIDSAVAKGTAGDILWRIGNPSNYGASGTQYANQAVHSARWVKPGYPGAGNIIFYANISPANSNYATGYEVTPTYSLSSSGEWQYKIVFSGTNSNSDFTNSGGIDKIFNGNWIVTYSNDDYTAYEFDASVGATQTKASSVGTWTSAGQNGLHRYPVCGGRLLAGVNANDAEAIALYNTMACGNSSSSSAIVVSSSSSIPEMEYSSSSAFSAISPIVNHSNFQLKANNNHIYLNDLIPNSRVSIADIHGTIKFNGIIQASEYKLNTTSWATGVYYINIVQPNKTTNYHTVMVIH